MATNENHASVAVFYRIHIDVSLRINQILQKTHVRSTRNWRGRRAYMTRWVNVNEARGVCKDRSRRRSVVTAYLHLKTALVYECMFTFVHTQHIHLYTYINM